MKAKQVKSAKSYLVARNGKGSAQQGGFSRYLRGDDMADDLTFAPRVGYSSREHAPRDISDDLAGAGRALWRADQAMANMAGLGVYDPRTDSHMVHGTPLAVKDPVNALLMAFPALKAPGVTRRLALSDDAMGAYRSSQEHVQTKARKLAQGARKKSESGAKKSINLNDKAAKDRRDSDQRIASHRKSEAPGKTPAPKPRPTPKTERRRKVSFAQFKARQRNSG